MYLEELPAAGTADLSLDERIIAEDAWALLKKGNTRKARKLFAKLGTSNFFYYTGMGYASYLLRELPAAEEFFKFAVRLKPNMTLAHLGLAQVYQDTGRLDNAFSEFREVLKNEPEHTWVVARYETIKAERTEALLNEAKTFLAGGSLDKGKETFLKALFFSPDSVDAHWNLAKIFFEEEKWTSALVHLKSAISKDPDNSVILKLYAETLFQAEDYKSSLEAFENLQESDPDNQEIKERLETIKNRLGIFELPSQYNAIPFSEAITKQDVAALVGVKFRSIMNERIQKPPIIIDIATSWAQKYIIKVTTLGILDVYPNHEFQPGKIITRAEAAITLVRLIDYLKKKGFSFVQHIPPDRIQLEDVSIDHFDYIPIIKILSYDIMSLESGRTFNPDRPVAGREMFKYIDIILALVQ
jgi:tetratricopeptide (TPR) repeat protein